VVLKLKKKEIVCRCSLEEHKKISKKAKEVGMAISSFCRVVALEASK
jgi:hypothetical protein